MLLFQSMVLDECKRLVEDSSDKSQNKIEELNSEIRKLKAMIGMEGLATVNSIQLIMFQ